MPGIATYTATKHAVLGYTDTARLELRGTGVTAVGGDADVDQYGDDRRTWPRMSGLRNAEPEDIAAGIVGLDREAEAALGRHARYRDADRESRSGSCRFAVNEASLARWAPTRIFADAADKQERPRLRGPRPALLGVGRRAPWRGPRRR